MQWYKPHEGQLPFHLSVAKIRGIFGGNRSGKTEAGAAETALFSVNSQKYRPRPIRKDIKILVGSESNEYNRDIIVPKLRKWIPKANILKEVRIQRGFVDFWTLPNDGTIKFKNYEQEADKWAGDDYDLIWLDEEPPSEIWKECLLRIIDRGGSIILTMTPIKGMTWVFTDVWEKSGTIGIECFLMDMDLNPYLMQADKDIALASLTEQEKKIRKEGKFIALHGLIYEKFNELKHCIEPFVIPQEWPAILGVDPHLKKPVSTLWATLAPYNYGSVAKGDWIIFKELRRSGIIPDIATAILGANGHRKIRVTYSDPSLNIKDNITGVNPFDEFADAGLPLEKANRAVSSGIYEIRRLLEEVPPGIKIFDDCRGLIWEFRHYSYADPPDVPSKDYNEKVRKRKDDYMDCLRYIINSGLKPITIGSRQQPRYIQTKTGRVIGVEHA